MFMAALFKIEKRDCIGSQSEGLSKELEGPQKSSHSTISLYGRENGDPWKLRYLPKQGLTTSQWPKRVRTQSPEKNTADVDTMELNSVENKQGTETYFAEKCQAPSYVPTLVTGTPLSNCNRCAVTPPQWAVPWVQTVSWVCPFSVLPGLKLCLHAQSVCSAYHCKTQKSRECTTK